MGLNAPPFQIAPMTETPEQSAILSLLDRVEALEAIVRRKAIAAYVRANPPAPIKEHTMSNLETHEAEQIAITAQWEATRAHQTPCERALEIMVETEGQMNEEAEYPTSRRAARALLAFAPAYDDDTAKQGLTDFLADAMHLCDAAGWTFSTILDRARNHYACEAHSLGKAADPALRRALENE